MKTLFLTAAFSALTLAGASAMAVHGKPAGELYTCAGSGLSRVSLRSDPAPCCTGMLGCPQLLANTGLVKPKRDNHT